MGLLNVEDTFPILIQENNISLACSSFFLNKLCFYGALHYGEFVISLIIDQLLCPLLPCDLNLP